MPDDTNNGNGNGTSSWLMYQRLVLSEIRRLDDAVKKLQDEKETIMIKIAVLQTKALIMGGIAGALLAGLIEFIMYLSLNHIGVHP